MPDCGSCRVANAYHRLDESNVFAFGLYQRYLTDAVVNPFPFAEKPDLLLDLASVRLILEAEEIRRCEWSEYIGKFQAIHRARESLRD